MTAQKRTAFFISDRTGITAEMLGHSLLTQFDTAVFSEITVPYVDSVEKTQAIVARINQQAITDGVRPLLFSTLASPALSTILAGANALFMDCFGTFIRLLEQELALPASHTVGMSHSAGDSADYHHRIDAVNFALNHDDGESTRALADADVILIGVSRCGKTPTCLYLAMQFGIRAANYPLVPEDYHSMRLPEPLQPLRKRLYGLTIEPARLQQVRSERRPGSSYAALDNCASEVREAEALMRQEGVPYLDTTSKSVEELATTILHEANLIRRVY